MPIFQYIFTKLFCHFQFSPLNCSLSRSILRLFNLKFPWIFHFISNLSKLKNSHQTVHEKADQTFWFIKTFAFIMKLTSQKKDPEKAIGKVTRRIKFSLTFHEKLENKTSCPFFFTSNKFHFQHSNPFHFWHPSLKCV